MAYHGMKLEEVKEPQVFDAPKEMLAWHTGHPTRRTIVAILPGGTAVDIDRNWLPHCAYIPEVPKSQRATHRELARWLAQGSGQLAVNPEVEMVRNIMTHHQYPKSRDNDPVPDFYMVRKWDDADRHEPTLKYLGLEE